MMKKIHVPFYKKIFELKKKNYLQIGLVFLLVAFIMTLFIVPSFLFQPPKYNKGDYALETIRASRTYEDIIDEQLTQQRIVEAESGVHPVFDYEQKHFEKLTQGMSSSFQSLRERTIVSEKEVLDAKVYFESSVGIKVSDELFRVIRALHFSSFLEKNFLSLMKGLDGKYIVASRQGLPNEPIQIRPESGAEYLFKALYEILSVKQAQLQLEEGMSVFFEAYRVDARREFIAFIKALVSPNLTYNKEQSDQKKELARKNVKPVTIRLVKGDVIISRGEQIQDRHLVVLKYLLSKKHKHRIFAMIFSMTIILFLLIFLLFSFGSSNLHRFYVSLKDFFIMVLLLSGAAAFTKMLFFVATGLKDAFPHVPLLAYQFAIPVAVTAMIVRFLLLSPHIALLFSLVLSVIFGFIFEQDFLFTVYAFAGCVVGIMGVSNVTERADLYKAGFKIGLANVIMVFAIVVMKSSDLTFVGAHVKYNLIAGFSSGILSSIIVMALVPVFEYFFHYTTDLKLLELANLNHPLLRRLCLEAPGTYNHSILVGNLVDAGASEIAANPLAARVGAYYHDIGKIIKPGYFIENQGGMENPHNHLTARMSSLIITSHVKEGLELAQQYKLGKPVKDAIEQHHGQTVIRFFYRKAVNTQDPQMGEIDTEDYRYPGPKPQTREVALIMLADACEAATRVIEKPNPERIQAACEKVVFGFFQDCQLDDSQLTLKDLNKVIQCFTKVLMGIYHQRIKYPAEEVAQQSQAKPPSNVQKLFKALGTRASEKK
ncbi:MAG: HDIG domain-containing protein [Deltaproteobacteria bacterium]|nr:HDIG domain-containing protein [Deltaproteobacteria bacterium]